MCCGPLICYVSRGQKFELYPCLSSDPVPSWANLHVEVVMAGKVGVQDEFLDPVGSRIEQNILGQGFHNQLSWH